MKSSLDDDIPIFRPSNEQPYDLPENQPVEQYYGVHATCLENAPKIKREGFKLSPADRYFGAGVYFYDKYKDGDIFANIHKEIKIKHKNCPENDLGVIINAKITSCKEKILDLEEEEYLLALEMLEKDFWNEYNHRDLPREEKKKKLNRRRSHFVLSLISGEITNIDLIKAALPYKRKKYSSGFVVYNTTCITDISY